MKKEKFLQEEIYLNEETGEWETRIIDTRTRKEFKEHQQELNKKLEENFYFPFREETLEAKRINKDIIATFDHDEAIGLDQLSFSEKKLYKDFAKRRNLAIEQKTKKRGGGRLAIPILEKDIINSMSHSGTIREAANFLHVSRQRWMKYAKMYIDKESGLNLYELHLKNCWGAVDIYQRRLDGQFSNGGLKRNSTLYNKLYKRLVDPVTGEYIPKEHRQPKVARNRKVKMFDVLQGLHPLYDPVKLKRNLLRTGWFERKCSCCGFSKTRKSDDTCPLVLNFKDGNSKNHLRENLEILCFNCFFINSSLWQNKKYYNF